MYKELYTFRDNVKNYIIGNLNGSLIKLIISDKYFTLSTIKDGEEDAKLTLINTTVSVIKKTIDDELEKVYKPETKLFAWQVGKFVSKSEYINNWFNTIFYNRKNGYYKRQIQEKLNISDDETNYICDCVEHILKKYICSIVDEGIKKFSVTSTI